MQEPLRVALSIVGIIIILFGAYYATYFIGLKASGQSRGAGSRSRNRNRNIVLLERFAISKDKSFCVVEVAGKTYVVGITNQSMTLLDTYEPGEYAELTTESDETGERGKALGGPLSGSFIGSVISIMARKMNKTRRMDDNRGMGDNKGMQGETFADAMNSARDKNTSGRPEREKAVQPDSSEVEG